MDEREQVNFGAFSVGVAMMVAGGIGLLIQAVGGSLEAFTAGLVMGGALSAGIALARQAAGR